MEEKKVQQKNPTNKEERKKIEARKEERRNEIPNAVQGLPFTVLPIKS